LYVGKHPCKRVQLAGKIVHRSLHILEWSVCSLQFLYVGSKILHKGEVISGSELMRLGS